METYSTFNAAKSAAETFFSATFGYDLGVGVESAQGNIIEFYSKDDPGMNDTFKAIVNDGREYFCKNGGQLKITRN